MSATAGLAEQKTWEPQPAAERVVQTALKHVCDALPIASNLRDRLLAEAGVRLGDLIDTFYVAGDAPLLAAAHAVGWKRAEKAGPWQLWRNAKGVFPQIASSAAIATAYVGMDLKVESVAHFLFVHGLHSDISRDIAGDVDDCFRRACVARNESAELAVTERLGWAGLLEGAPGVDVSLRQRIYESFLLRPRQAVDEAIIFDAVNDLVDRAIDATNRDVACALFFAAERQFWMQRNRAAVLQYNRQQRLGIGWANHDHHTYRSSRQYFSKLVALWEKLGLICRERFYAGREAGWGAQVMEQPVTGIVTFNDVDLSPDELFGDFSHDGLAPRDRLGTIGLWCGLHGESLTSAGMHHLEAMFGFDALRDQLTNAGVGVMKPFTDFGYLRQAFTEGERWAVSPTRIDRLLTLGLITAEQAETFRAKGALGSHLENLERNAGFKGFNQTGVSEIIAATDPRKR